MDGTVMEKLAGWQVFILQLGIIWTPLVVAAIKQTSINKELRAENQFLRKKVITLEAKNRELEAENDQLREEFISELRQRANNGRKGI